MRSSLKSLGSGILGCGAFLLFIVGGIVIFALGARYADVLYIWTSVIAGIVLLIDVLILLPMLIAKRLRSTVGTGLIISSYVFGLALWFYGLLGSLVYLGIGWTVIGLLFAGVGVVPLAAIGAAIHGQWAIVVGLFINLAFVYGFRALGIWISEKYDYSASDHRDVIEGELVPESSSHRPLLESWDDIKKEKR